MQASGPEAPVALGCWEGEQSGPCRPLGLGSAARSREALGGGGRVDWARAGGPVSDSRRGAVGSGPRGGSHGCSLWRRIRPDPWPGSGTSARGFALVSGWALTLRSTWCSGRRGQAHGGDTGEPAGVPGLPLCGGPQEAGSQLLWVHSGGTASALEGQSAFPLKGESLAARVRRVRL